MNRRGFFERFAKLTAAAALVPAVTRPAEDKQFTHKAYGYGWISADRDVLVGSVVCFDGHPCGIALHTARAGEIVQIQISN